MGNPAFEHYQAAIKARISNLNDTVDSLKKQIVTLAERVRQEIGLPESQQKLTELEGDLSKNENTIAALKKLFVTLSTKWSTIEHRVIGHVDWAPAIAWGVGPNRYTVDFCVVELYKRKFTNFVGNVLSLGTWTCSLFLKFSLIWSPLQDPNTRRVTSSVSCTNGPTYPPTSNTPTMVFFSFAECSPPRI